MEWLVVIGAAMSLAGLGVLLWCIVAALRMRRAGLDDDAMRARLQTIVIWNMGAVGISALGLIMAVVGILLG